MSKRLPDGTVVNFLGLCLLLFLQIFFAITIFPLGLALVWSLTDWILLLFLFPPAEALSEIFNWKSTAEHLFDYIHMAADQEMTYIRHISDVSLTNWQDYVVNDYPSVLTFTSNLIRLGLTLVFLLSWLLQPLKQSIC